MIARQQMTSVPLRPSKHRAVSATVTMLAKDPSLGGKQIAGELGISVSRLARVFKRDMGMSLVEYRNRLRLDRFWVLVDGGRPSLLEAALAAGFGSYAQFHRVFRAQRHLTPREYLRRRRAYPNGRRPPSRRRFRRRVTRRWTARATWSWRQCPGRRDSIRNRRRSRTRPPWSGRPSSFTERSGHWPSSAVSWQRFADRRFDSAACPCARWRWWRRPVAAGAAPARPARSRRGGRAGQAVPACRRRRTRRCRR